MKNLYPPQVSFNGGEISSALYGRTDLAKYKNSLKQAENMFIHTYGGASNRPGTKYIGEAYSSTTQSRLIPFTYSVSLAYVFEIAHKTVGIVESTIIRVIKEDAFLEVLGTPIEIVLSASQHLSLADVYYAQTANLMIITHPSQAPVQITRDPVVETTWSSPPITFGSDLAAPTAPVVTAGIPAPPQTGKDYYYKITRVDSDTGAESLPSVQATLNWGYPLAVDNWLILTWVADVAPTDVTGYNVYRKEAGVWAWTGYAENPGVGNVTFNDDGIAADMSDTAPVATTPFASPEFPAVVGFYEQRSIFATTPSEIQKMWLSETSNYFNFNTRVPLNASDPMNFTVAADKINEIRHFVSLGSLFMLTSGGEWLITAEGVLSPSTISIQQQSYWGSSSIKPIVTGSTILFVERGGDKIRDLTFSSEAGGLVGSEVSVMTPHLFRGFEVVDWTFQQKPNSIVWIVRDDGMLIGCTYVREQQVNAFHHHTTQGEYESVCSIPTGTKDELYVVVNRTTGRFIERFMPTILEEGDVEDCFYVDSGLTFDGSARGTAAVATITLASLTAKGYISDFSLADGGSGYSVGDVLTVVQTGASGGTITVTGVDGVTGAVTGFGLTTAGIDYEIESNLATTVLPAGGTGCLVSTTEVGTAVVSDQNVFGAGDVGDRITVDGVGIGLIIDYTDAKNVDIFIETTFEALVQVYGAWYITTETITGLTHLIAQTVAVYADGNVFPTDTVSGAGTITLSGYTSYCTVGLPYRSYIQLLTLDFSQVLDEFSVNNRRVSRVDAKLEKTRGMLAGYDLDNLIAQKIEYLQYGVAPALYNGDWDLVIEGQWDKDGSIIIAQEDPIPLNLISLTPEVSVAKR